MATHSIPLPGKSHGWRSLVGHNPWGHKDTAEWLINNHQQESALLPLLSQRLLLGILPWRLKSA